MEVPASEADIDFGHVVNAQVNAHFEEANAPLLEFRGLMLGIERELKQHAHRRAMREVLRYGDRLGPNETTELMHLVNFIFNLAGKDGFTNLPVDKKAGYYIQNDTGNEERQRSALELSVRGSFFDVRAGRFALADAVGGGRHDGGNTLVGAVHARGDRFDNVMLRSNAAERAFLHHE